MATKILIQHKNSGILKNGYYGYSWTYLIFGWFVPVFRGELGTGALHLLFTIFTFGIWQLVVSFLYNRQYMTRMLTTGWHLAGSESENKVAEIALRVSAVNLGTSPEKQLIRDRPNPTDIESEIMPDEDKEVSS